MKKALFVFCLSLVCATQSWSQVIFSDNFNSYTDGALIGQGPWVITGTSTVNPIQVNGGVVSLLNTGQDANAPVSGGPVTLSDGQSIDFSMDINVSAAQAAGDYFFHFTPDGGTSLFYSRVFIQSSDTGYLLGWLGTSGSGSTVTYGSTVLSFNQSYNIDVYYNYSAATPTSSTGAISVDGSSYLTSSWTSPNADTSAIQSVNFRQGSSGSAPTLTVDNLVVTISTVPEPSTFALATLGGVACLFALRRKS